MKKTFSLSWKSSKQPRKQRKYKANVPLHLKRKFLSAHLGKELREKYKRRNFPLVSGDKVKIFTGQFKGKEGKIDRVALKRGRVYITGIERARKDGSKSMYPFQPSNLLIIELNLKDKKRKEALERNLKSEDKN
ncbi:50S ribosomal protein L24 [Candidatus Woesearchaeota archaeon]|jgi:large subunit ribosomal protein L24|nr:50S ribosomal protein L24 [Candidatus Woesearchaeota archaeon]MBT6520308.1 50S ribosomal protein L24 [Candidatus Woesearchaeota archaeon]MBT7368260.1 50S ribosomal protein L24 [Candidatus Woesearchaeota archaeon]